MKAQAQREGTEPDSEQELAAARQPAARSQPPAAEPDRDGYSTQRRRESEGVLEQDARRVGEHDSEQWHRLQQGVPPRDRLDGLLDQWSTGGGLDTRVC